ncbi:hypothetical protein E1263_36740 [Kribbella antibiotica]|uniref:Uncharacterized protein n=1 Tax=Kribbella antibiotica TaxID=190195 RepID=A0A4R4YMU8_9ACTN|nr:hypothetical protein [Kribbella antibiotica]TDD46326.1 hypothetical protein E1263_36740 [Kribbella antibiotica]
MAPTATTIPARLQMWRRVREYAVPPSMIETATARRAAGDWAGACAAARVDTDLDLRAVRDRYGTELVARLRADLRRLAPDLLRWHLPRVAPDGRLRPGLTIVLSRYGATPLQLVVRTPPTWADAGQRMSLAVWDPGISGPRQHPHPRPSRRFRLDLHRHLWDSTRYGELAARCGAVDWSREAELLLADAGRLDGIFAVRRGSRSYAVLELVAPDNSHVPTVRLLRDVLSAQDIPVLPEAAAQVLPDLDLLQAGLITVDRLHPLVATALAAVGPASPADAALPLRDPHRVECRGEMHRIELRGGALAAIDHDPAQLRREELLAALGGPPLPCLRAIDAALRDPEELPAVRERIGHGDIAGALDVLEGLLGPGAILRQGPLRDELETALARRVDHGLFRSGLVSAVGAVGRGACLAWDWKHVVNRRVPVAMRRKRGRRTSAV